MCLSRRVQGLGGHWLEQGDMKGGVDPGPESGSFRQTTEDLISFLNHKGTNETWSQLP